MSTIRVVNVQHTDATEPNIVLQSDGTSVFASGITISGGTNLTVSGTAEFASGTVSAPGITFIDDNNTGIYEPAADTVAITTAATERLRVNSAGNIGIGTTSPESFQSGARNLVVGTGSGDNGISIFAGSANEGRIYFARTGELIRGQVKYDFSADKMHFAVDSSNKLTIDNAGNVGIGTTTPIETLEIKSATNTTLRISNEDDSTAKLYFRNAGSTDMNISVTNAEMIFNGGSNERMRIDSAGRLLVGTSSSVATGFNQGANIQIFDDTGSFAVRRGAANEFGPTIALGKTRSTTDGSFTIVQDDDSLGAVRFTGDDGVDFQTQGAKIEAFVDGTPGANDMPGRLVFSTTADGSSSPTERMQINSNGVLISSHATINGGVIGTNGNELRLQSDINANGTPFTSFYTGSSERMRITSVGELLVGTTSPIAAASKESHFQVSGTGQESSSASLTRFNSNNQAPSLVFGKANGSAVTNGVGNGTQLGRIEFAGSDGTDINSVAARIDCYVDGTPGSNDMPGRIRFLTTPDGSAAPTERMRITNEGIVYHISTNHGYHLGVTAAAGTSKFLFRGHRSATAGTYNSGTNVFNVWSNGNVQNTNNSYGSLSDAKLKENIVDASSQWDDIKDIRIRNYNFIEGETHTQIGVVAQEVESVSPGLVYESPDQDEEGNDLGTVTKSVNYSVLYMKAVKALQETMDRIETLEAKVAALEAG